MLLTRLVGLVGILFLLGADLAVAGPPFTPPGPPPYVPPVRAAPIPATHILLAIGLIALPWFRPRIKG